MKWESMLLKGNNSTLSYKFHHLSHRFHHIAFNSFIPAKKTYNLKFSYLLLIKPDNKTTFDDFLY